MVPLGVQNVLSSSPPGSSSARSTPSSSTLLPRWTHYGMPSRASSTAPRSTSTATARWWTACWARRRRSWRTTCGCTATDGAGPTLILDLSFSLFEGRETMAMTWSCVEQCGEQSAGPQWTLVDHMLSSNRRLDQAGRAPGGHVAAWCRPCSACVTCDAKRLRAYMGRRRLGRAAGTCWDVPWTGMVCCSGTCVCPHVCCRGMGTLSTRYVGVSNFKLLAISYLALL